MRTIFLMSAGLCICLTACKKDEKIQRDAAAHTQQTAPADTAAATAPEIRATDHPVPFSVEPIQFDVAPGKTIFTEGGRVLIGFNTDAQKGWIRISGKDYDLNSLTFSENNYEIKGNGITISATNGNFAEMVSDCAYGTFPEVKINLNGRETVLKNINVQDCPNYH